MFQFPGKVGDFLYRHKRKFIFVGVFVGGVYGSMKYAQYKIKDWMTEEEKKYLEEVRKQQHFEKTQEHCFVIAEAVVKSLKDTILVLVNTENILDSLKSGKSPEEKLELWNELKVTVFTRVASCLYILTFSAIIIRIQLNHLAAKVYARTKKEHSNVVTDVTQRWFLSISHEFIASKGLNRLVAELEKISFDLVETMPLQCQVKGANIEAVLKSMHDRLKQRGYMSFCEDDDSSTSNIFNFLVPSSSELDYEDDIVLKKQLVDEMWDIFDSNDCMKVLDTCVLQTFHDYCRIIDASISETVGTHSRAVSIEFSPIGNSQSACLPLAKVLPMINSQVHAIASDNFIRKILSNETLTKFSANVYESFTNQSANMTTNS